MNMVFATYNIHYNSIDVYTYAGYFLRINCGKAEAVGVMLWYNWDSGGERMPRIQCHTGKCNCDIKQNTPLPRHYNSSVIRRTGSLGRMVI